MKYIALKYELKELAKEIKNWKSWRKPKNRVGFDLQQWDVDEAIYYRSRDFRHKHIAYCQLRGRTRQEIERPAKNNLPDEKIIEEIMSDHAEDVCVSAERSA